MIVVVVVVIIEGPWVTVFSSINQSFILFQVKALPNKSYLYLIYFALSPLSPDPHEFFLVHGLFFSPVAESSKVQPINKPNDPEPLDPLLWCTTIFFKGLCSVSEFPQEWCIIGFPFEFY